MKPGKKAVKDLRKRLADALARIDKSGPLEERVHELRTDLKKSRAALKLLRPAVGEKLYRRQNEFCRDAARLLSATRDAQALRSAWETLGIRLRQARRTLESDAQQAAERLARDKSALPCARSLLKQAEASARRLSLPSGWRGIQKGLRKSYGDARRAGRMAARKPADANFHEWRKRVKDQRYQLDLLAEDAKELRSLGSAVERLSDVLGEEHDLSVLRDKISREPDRFGGAGSDAALLAIERKKKGLRRRALRLGQEVYRLKPKAFTRGVKRAWKRRSSA